MARVGSAATQKAQARAVTEMDGARRRLEDLAEGYRPLSWTRITAGHGRTPPRARSPPRTAAELAFCALGPVAEAWLRSSAASGNPRLAPELAELAALEAAHGRDALVAALERVIAFGRWKASGVRSILAAGAGVAQTTAPGQALLLALPSTASRSLADYKLDNLTDELGGGA
jgi:hypothetical protein